MLARIISILIGYACGHFLTGFFYGKTQHVDLRKVGSGNVGTTNTYRNLGPKAGILTLLGDVFKVVKAQLDKPGAPCLVQVKTTKGLMVELQVPKDAAVPVDEGTWLKLRKKDNKTEAWLRQQTKWY